MVKARKSKSSRRRDGEPASPARKGSTSARSTNNPAARRKFVVFVSLLGLLSFTSVLLMALSPAPLTNGATASLFAIDAPASLDSIFQTNTPLSPGRWKYIFVHQSQTARGSASEFSAGHNGPADHFIIGNGEGAVDGELQVAERWFAQSHAGAIAGIDKMDPGCISICLVGDLDHAAPTSTQNLRVHQLVSALQRRLNIGADQVLLIDGGGTPSHAGRYFPAAVFRQQLAR